MRETTVTPIEVNETLVDLRNVMRCEVSVIKTDREERVSKGMDRRRRFWPSVPKEMDGRLVESRRGYWSW